jgi:DNA-binding transcriptional LysR family regulator
METKYLHYFLQICEDRSLSKASRNLYLSQQALSAVVRKLEEELQVPLFERSKSGMHPTEYGECLEEYARKIVRTLNETQDKINTLKSGHHDVLNIGMSFGVMSALPAHYINDFKQFHPEIELRFTEYQDTFCECSVLNEHEDLGFNIAPVDSELFSVRTVIRDKMCILVNEKNPFSQRTTVRFEELREEPLLLLNNNFKVRQIVNRKCREAGFEPRVELETMELILIHNFSGLKKGVGIGVDFIAHDMTHLRSVPFEPECPWEVCFIAKKGKRRSKAAQSFIRYVEQFACFCPGQDSDDPEL